MTRVIGTGVAIFAAVVLAGHVGPIPWIADTNSLVITWGESTTAEDADPLITHTVESYAESYSATGTAVGAEIKGYLVDWVTRRYDLDGYRGGSAVEIIVMKDGSLYGFPVQGPRRPASAFGHRPSPRLEPESPMEADDRQRALGRAQLRVAKIFPKYSEIEPEIFAYFLVVSLADGSEVDVMADPSGDGPPQIYDLGLVKFDRGHSVP